jgi:hypothetical protein
LDDDEDEVEESRWWWSLKWRWEDLAGGAVRRVARCWRG